MKTVFTFALLVIILTGCSIQRWEGKSRDDLLSKKGMPDKVENNGEDQIYYYCKPNYYAKTYDENYNLKSRTDTAYTYQVFAIKKSNTIFFVSEEISYVAPGQFTVIEE
jgi:hypothetical protein